MMVTYSCMRMVCSRRGWLISINMVLEWYGVIYLHLLFVLSNFIWHVQLVYVVGRDSSWILVFATSPACQLWLEMCSWINAEIVMDCSVLLILTVYAPWTTWADTFIWEHIHKLSFRGVSWDKVKPKPFVQTLLDHTWIFLAEWRSDVSSDVTWPQTAFFGRRICARKWRIQRHLQYICKLFSYLFFLCVCACVWVQYWDSYLDFKVCLAHCYI